MQRITRLLWSSTSKDAFITLIGNASVAIGGMLFTVIAARALAPENFGVFSALFALVTLSGSLSDLGISSALVNFIPKLPANRHLILSITFWTQLVIALLLTLITLLFVPLHSRLFPGSLPIHLVVLAVWTFVAVFETFSQSLLKAEKKFVFTSIVMAVSSWLKLGFTFALFLVGEVNIQNILFAGVAASSLATAIGFAHELKNIRPLFPRPQAMEIFHFAKWIALMRVFSVAISRVDVILLNAMAGNFQAGIFSAASRVALLFALMVSTLGSVVAPRFSGFTKKEHTLSYLKKLTLLISGVAVLMLISMAFAPLIINLVFGPEYAPAIPVFRALVLAMLPFLFTIITVNPLIYTFNLPNFVAIATVVQVVSLIGLDLLLIPRYGAYGPIIALAASNLLVLLLTGRKLYSLLK